MWIKCEDGGVVKASCVEALRVNDSQNVVAIVSGHEVFVASVGVYGGRYLIGLILTDLQTAGTRGDFNVRDALKDAESVEGSYWESQKKRQEEALQRNREQSPNS